MRWHERIDKNFWLVIAILALVVFGIVSYVKVPSALPWYLVGLPVGWLVGQWLRARVTVARLAVAIALLLALSWYTVYSWKVESLLTLTSYFISFAYVVATLLPSHEWEDIRRLARGTPALNRKLGLIAMGGFSIVFLWCLVDIFSAVARERALNGGDFLTVFLIVNVLVISISHFKKANKELRECQEGTGGQRSP